MANDSPFASREGPQEPSISPPGYTSPKDSDIDGLVSAWYILVVIVILLNFSFLKEEISFEPHDLKLDVIPGVDLKYDLTIKNIGSEYLELNYSVSGIDQKWTPPHYPIPLSDVVVLPIEIQIPDISLPGEYKGNITIRNNKTGHILDTIPVTLSVKGVNCSAEAFGRITIQPANQIVETNKSVTFRVTATGTPPFSYQWNKDGKPISGANTSRLSIASASSDDAGNYTVDISNAYGTVTSVAASLTIVNVTPKKLPSGIPPKIIRQPVSQPIGPAELYYRNPVTLSVKAEGTSPLKYQWMWQNQKIPDGTKETYTNSLPQVGDYWVVVSNEYGSVVSKRATFSKRDR